MAKSSDMRSAVSSSSSSSTTNTTDTEGGKVAEGYQDDLMYMKKGWLLKQGVTDKDWSKHWFVLSGNTLRYFADSWAEERQIADGLIDLSTCLEVDDASVNRNYGFKIKTNSGEYILSAMTSGIRNNWIQALEKCRESCKRSSTSPGPVSGRDFPQSPKATYAWSPSLRSSSTSTRPGEAASPVTPPVRDRSNSRGSGESGTGVGMRSSRRLTMDTLVRSPQPSSSPSPSRESVSSTGSGSKKHRVSCTWPYVSEAEANRRSEVADLVSREDEQSTQPQRAAHNNTELDNVEKNIRSINRKSITEFSQKPAFLDKFESGFRDEEHTNSAAAGKRERRDSSSSSYASSTYSSNSPARYSVVSRAKSPGQQQLPQQQQQQHRAPSTKVKEKSRAKSPRPKSPPLSMSTMPKKVTEVSSSKVILSKVEPGEMQEGRPPDVVCTDEDESSIVDDIIEKKWREVEKSGGLKALEDSSPQPGGGDVALVQLLETEVETLKTRLECTLKDLEEAHKSNLDLKTQIRTSRIHHHDSLNDMELDQSRFLSQIQDIQDEMESTTEYYKKKLGDQDNRAHLTKLQVQTLRDRLKQAQDTIRRHEKTITELTSQLESASSSTTANTAHLNKAILDAKDEAESWKEKAAELEARIRDLQHKLRTIEAEKEELLQESKMNAAEMHELKVQLEEKADRIEALEAESEETGSAMKEEIHEKEVFIEDLQQEVTMTKKQMRDQDEVMQKQKQDMNKRVKQMEDEFYGEKEKLEDHIQQLQHRLEGVQRQSSMSDSLTSNMTELMQEKDETIAQLEEKLIENDNRIEEVKEEMKIEIEDNTRLQQSLDQTYRENTMLKEQMEELKAAVEMLENELQQVGQQNQSLSNNKTDLQKEMEHLRKRNKELGDRVAELLEENGAFKMVIDEQGVDLENWEDKYQRDIEDLKHAEVSEEKVDELEKELHSVYSQLEQLHREHEELKMNVNNDREENDNHVKKAQLSVNELQMKLQKKENELADYERKMNESKAVEKDMVSEKDYEELKKKLTNVSKDFVQIKHKLKETEVKNEGLVSENMSYKDQLNMTQNGSDVETQKLQGKVAELQNKLGVAERRVRRFEARRRSGGFEDREDSPPPTSQSPDPELMNRIQNLEQELVEAKKAANLQRAFQVEVVTLRQLEKQLRQENQECNKKLESYKKEAGPYCLEEVKGQLAEVQIKYEKSQAIVHDCQERIQALLKNTSSAMSNKDCAALKSVNEKLSSSVGGVSCMSEQDSIRAYGEKLALEALVLGEMAYLVRGNETELVTEKEQLLHEIEEANHRIFKLEQTVCSLEGKEFTNQHLLDKTAISSMHVYARLLSEKMILQGKMAALVAEKQGQVKSPRSVPPHSPMAEHMAQKALFKVKLDERLHTSHQSSQCLDVTSTSTLSSAALVQGQLDHYMKTLEEKISENASQKEKVDVVEKQITNAKCRLLNKQSSLDKSLEKFRQEQIEKLAYLIVTQAMQQAKNVMKSDSKTDRKIIDKEFVQSEVASLVNTYTAFYDNQLPMNTSANAVKRSALIEEHVQKEIKVNVDDLVKRCEQRKQDFKLRDTDENKDLESEKTDLLAKFADVLAQKAIVSGQIAFVNQFAEEHSKVLASSPTRPRSKTSLKRHDSGIMVHGASLPTSPTEQLEQIDQNELAERLQKEAGAKSEIATFLVNNSSSCVADAENLDLQITRLAAEMGRVDSRILQCDHNRSSNAHWQVSHFAELLSSEAIFQAELSYIINLMKLKHNQELEQQRTDFESTESQRRHKNEAHVSELEDEIHRLSTVLAEKESQLEKRIKETHLAATDNHDELARKETLFKQEIQSLKDGYEIRIRSLQSDLEGLRNERDGIQQERYDDTQNYEQKIQAIEQELRTVRREMHEAVQAKDDEIQIYGDRVGSLEEELRGVYNKMDSPRGEGDDLDEAADEVKRLRALLAEEKTKHMAELLQLREHISGGDQDAAAQSVLNTRIQQLEEQIQNMQADYEEELTLTKSAHRRELARSKDDMLELLAQAEAKSLHLDEGVIRRKYVKELDRIKEIYDRGFSSMEKSHQKVMMEMRKAHKREMEVLRREKDQLLDEETKATQAALDAMRKAHEAELQKERNKFIDMLAKTYSHADVETLQKQHEEDLQLIQREISQLSEEYSVKCLENASLEERLEMQTKALHDSRKRVQDLIARNDELNMRIKHELEKLNRMVSKPGHAAGPMKKETETQEVYDLKMALQIKELQLEDLQAELSHVCSQLATAYKVNHREQEKEHEEDAMVAMKLKVAEVKHLAEEVAALKAQLVANTQELEASLDKNEKLFTEHQTMRRRYERELQELRRELAERDRQARERDEEEQMDSQEEDDEASKLDLASLSSRADTPCSTESEGSPSPKRSKHVVLMEATAGSRPVSTSGRQLPLVSEEARTNKKALWRQRHPERSRSNPGPVLMSMPKRLSLDSSRRSSSSQFDSTEDLFQQESNV